MSLAENYKRNQFTTPWTTAAKATLIELWPTGITIEKIAHTLLAKHGHLWSPQSISWKAEHLRLPARKHPTIWTEEIEAQLRAHWKNDECVISIADLLFQSTGIRFSRNAIIGKAHRLGLERHANANRAFLSLEDRAEHRKNYNKNWIATNRAHVNALARLNAQRRRGRVLAPLIEDFAIPTPQRKTIYELGRDSCRWPIGDPKSDQFFFCGAIAENEKPYCSGHCARAYREPNPR